MAAVHKTTQKRRSSARVKTQKAAKVSEVKPKGKQAPVSPGKSWVHEIASLMLLAAGLLMLASVGSYVYSAVYGDSSVTARNVVGPVGHAVAELLVLSLGVGVVIPIVGLVWLALFRARDGEASHRYGKILVAGSFTTLLVTLCTMVSVVAPRWGGDVGAWIAARLIRTLGAGGGIGSALLIAAVSGVILAQRTVGDLLSGIQWTLSRGGRLAFVTVPTTIGKGVYRAVALALKRSKVAVMWLYDLAFGVGKVTSLPAELPKPRVRKNVLPLADRRNKDEDASEDEGEEHEGEPTYERADPVIVKPKPPTTKPTKARGATAEKESSTSNERPFDGYVHPDVSLLVGEEIQNESEDDEELRQKAEQIELKLRDFNIAGRVTQVHPGPVITLFEFEPAPGVKVGRIAALQDDLAMSLKASNIRIIAPIPKRGTVGIEVPNKQRALVRLRECLECEGFTTADSVLSIPLGKDTYGEPVVVDIATMPHLLMAGATGTGKSVCINTVLLSLLYRAHPSELGLILIDPKVLELSIYDGIPHLRVPVVTDPRQAKAVLSWAVKEMDRRYRYMQKFGVRNIDGYNQVVAGTSEDVTEEPAEGIKSDDEERARVEPVVAEKLQPLPKLVIVIDELADLMLTVGREIEELITRLAQKARAAGIHLILATQRPSVDVITGLIKANFPARLSFRVSSRIDSRTILDSMGAEKLLGKGDMLFMLPGAVPLKRIHGAFVSDQEVQKVVSALKSQCTPQYDENIIAACEKALTEESGEGGEGGGGEGESEFDPLYDKAVELVLEKGQASTSMIQRVFRIGYNRAARIIETMEREGVVGRMDGVRPREVLSPAAHNKE